MQEISNLKSTKTLIFFYLFALNSDNKISYLEIMIRLNNSSDDKVHAILDTEPRLFIGNLPKLRDVARQGGGLAELPVALAVGLDLVHLGGRDLLREDEGLGRVVIVILNEISLATQNWVQLYDSIQK